MKQEQITAIKKETEVDKIRYSSVLNDTRTTALLYARMNGDINTEDLALQMYMMGYEDRRNEPL